LTVQKEVSLRHKDVWGAEEENPPFR